MIREICEKAIEAGLTLNLQKSKIIGQNLAEKIIIDSQELKYTAKQYTSVKWLDCKVN